MTNKNNNHVPNVDFFIGHWYDPSCIGSGNSVKSSATTPVSEIITKIQFY